LKAEGYHVFLYGFDKDIQLETLECETDKDLVILKKWVEPDKN